MTAGRNRRIHCKWCSYTTPIWYHIIDRHPEHGEEARELTADDYYEDPNPHKRGGDYQDLHKRGAE